MKWNKRGLIFTPDIEHGFCKTRVMCPTPFLIKKNIIRIYCGFCDNNGISRPGFVDVNAENPSNILNISSKPLLEIGQDGMFDDNGLCPTSIFEHSNKVYMYYFAFQRGAKVPFYMFSGLAISDDRGNNFSRVQKVPVLDRSDKEPLMRSGPFVIYDKESKIFKVWYPSGNSFIDVNGKKIHKYVIKYAESKDGINWPNEGRVVLGHENSDEYGFGRPYIVKNCIKGYKLFYSIRTISKGYRLGYAESENGINWVRKDNEIGINVSREGWDRNMQCYCSFFKFKNKTYLFYNGNDLGKTGFGYAELEID